MMEKGSLLSPKISTENHQSLLDEDIEMAIASAALTMDNYLDQQSPQQNTNHRQTVEIRLKSCSKCGATDHSNSTRKKCPMHKDYDGPDKGRMRGEIYSNSPNDNFRDDNRNEFASKKTKFESPNSSGRPCLKCGEFDHMYSTKYKCKMHKDYVGPTSENNHSNMSDRTTLIISKRTTPSAPPIGSRPMAMSSRCA